VKAIKTMLVLRNLLSLSPADQHELHSIRPSWTRTKSMLNLSGFEKLIMFIGLAFLNNKFNIHTAAIG
jgi:hypothetical protein